MKEVGREFFDVVKIVAWSAGVIFRQFELGREGYLPELVSKEGKAALRGGNQTKQEDTDKITYPMGFA